MQKVSHSALLRADDQFAQGAPTGIFSLENVAICVSVPSLESFGQVGDVGAPFCP